MWKINITAVDAMSVIKEYEEVVESFKYTTSDRPSANFNNEVVDVMQFLLMVCCRITVHVISDSIGVGVSVGSAPVVSTTQVTGLAVLP